MADKSILGRIKDPTHFPFNLASLKTSRTGVTLEKGGRGGGEEKLHLASHLLFFLSRDLALCSNKFEGHGSSYIGRSSLS